MRCSSLSSGTCRSRTHWKPQVAEKLAHIVSDLTPKLLAMDRYERRALSRRKFAIRALNTTRAKATALGLHDQLIGAKETQLPYASS